MLLIEVWYRSRCVSWVSCASSAGTVPLIEVVEVEIRQLGELREVAGTVPLIEVWYR